MEAAAVISKEQIVHKVEELYNAYKRPR